MSCEELMDHDGFTFIDYMKLYPHYYSTVPYRYRPLQSFSFVVLIFIYALFVVIPWREHVHFAVYVESVWVPISLCVHNTDTCFSANQKSCGPADHCKSSSRAPKQWQYCGTSFSNSQLVWAMVFLQYLNLDAFMYRSYTSHHCKLRILFHHVHKLR